MLGLMEREVTRLDISVPVGHLGQHRDTQGVLKRHQTWNPLSLVNLDKFVCIDLLISTVHSYLRIRKHNP